MIDIYIGIGIFLLVYMSYLSIIILNKKRLSRYILKSQETTIIKNRYKLNYDKINHKLVANLFAVTNGLILGFSYVLISIIKNIILKFLITLLFLIVVVTLFYLLIGIYLKKKQEV